MARSFFANSSSSASFGTPPPQRATNTNPRGHRSASQLPNSSGVSGSPTSGRRCQVILLDDRKLDFLLQPKLTAGNLLDLVTSHFNQKKEKDYFALAYRDETGHYGWLQNDRRVLDHDFPNRPPATLYLYFLVRFYVESITHLQHATTVELFYLQAKSCFSKGQLDCDDEKAVRLIALGLQVALGDCPFGSSVDTNAYDGNSAQMSMLASTLSRLDLVPPSLSQNQSPIENEKLSPAMENVYAHILAIYQGMAGQPRGQAIVSFMAIVESLPTYGVHYYEVRDKHGTTWWLGLSPQGIAVYPQHDKKNPRRMYQWRQLENLYFREKKFSVEIHDQRRSNAPNQSGKSGSRTFGPSNVNVHVWFAATPTLCKTIWSMAICQHQFYLDRKTTKTQQSNVRSINTIAAELSQSSLSLASSGGGSGADAAAVEQAPINDNNDNDNHDQKNIRDELMKPSHPAMPRSGSTNSLPGSLNICSEDKEASTEAKRDMHSALKARKVALEDSLKRKMDELKKYCIQEAEITGQVPKEISEALAPGEAVPPIRRRVGTAYAINERILNDDEEDETDENAAQEKAITELELQYEIQKQITNAALRLVSDPKALRAVRRQRRTTYDKSFKKLKEIEHSLNTLKKTLGKTLARKDSYDDLDDDGPNGNTNVSDTALAEAEPGVIVDNAVNANKSSTNKDKIDNHSSNNNAVPSTGPAAAPENPNASAYPPEVLLGPEQQYPGQYISSNSSPHNSAPNASAPYSTQSHGLVKQCSAPALSNSGVATQKPLSSLHSFPEDDESAEKAQENLNLSLDTVDVIDLSLNSPTNLRMADADHAAVVAAEPPYTKVSKPGKVPSPRIVDVEAIGAEPTTTTVLPPVVLRHPTSRAEISDTRPLNVDAPPPSSLMPLTPPANSSGFRHHFPSVTTSNHNNVGAMHASMNAPSSSSSAVAGAASSSSAMMMAPPFAGGVGSGVPATPLQMQLLYASVGQYDCGSRTRASLAQAADGSLDETLSREMAMETLSLEDGSTSSASSASGGHRDDVISIVSSSSDGPDSSFGGVPVSVPPRGPPLSSHALAHNPAAAVAAAAANSQVAVSITRGACMPPNANNNRQGGAMHAQPGVVSIPVQHSRGQPSQGPAFSHGETTLDRFHRQATAGSVHPYPLPANRQQPTRSVTIELPVEHHQPIRTSPRPNSSHHGGSVPVPIQGPHHQHHVQQPQPPSYQLQQQQQQHIQQQQQQQQQQLQQQLQQQYLQQQYQQQLQAGDRRSFASNHSSSSDRSASNASVAASTGSATPLSASRQYRRLISSEAAESVADRLARLSSSIQELQKDVTDAQKVRLLTSGFAISPSRPQTPRGDGGAGGGGGGGGGFSLPLSLPPNRDKSVNVSPRGQQGQQGQQGQRGVVGYAAVQVLGNPNSAPSGNATNFQPFKETSKPFEMADVYKYSSRFRSGPTSPSSSSVSPSSNPTQPPPPPQQQQPPPHSRPVSQRGASAPPERQTSVASMGVADRKTLHAGVPLTAPGLSGSADATGATTTIRVGGSSSTAGNNNSNINNNAAGYGYPAPPSYDAATVSSAPIRRLRDNTGVPAANSLGGGAATTQRPLPSSTSNQHSGTAHRRHLNKGPQQASLVRLPPAPGSSVAPSDPSGGGGGTVIKVTSQGIYPSSRAASCNGTQSSTHPQPPAHPQPLSHLQPPTHPPYQTQGSTDSQRAGIPKRNPALPPNEQGLFPQGAVLPRSPAMMQIGNPSSHAHPPHLSNGEMKPSSSSSSSSTPSASNSSSLDSFPANANQGGTMLMTMAGPGMSSTFSEEMIAWYADRETQPPVGPEEEEDADRGDDAGKQATLV